MKGRLFAFAFVLASFALGATPLPARASQPSDWSRVPLEIRKQLHLNIHEVPPYPDDDNRLRHVKLWPKTRVVVGTTYVQEFSAWKSDMGRPSLRSLSEIDSGWKYGSQYVAYSRSGKRRSIRGPSYMWYPDSSVYERSFLTAYSSRSWYYDLQGNLRVYMVSVKGSGCQPGKSTTESFGTDGSLVGFESHTLKQYYWMGEKLEWQEYDRLRNKFWKWE